MTTMLAIIQAPTEIGVTRYGNLGIKRQYWHGTPLEAPSLQSLPAQGLEPHLQLTKTICFFCRFLQGLHNESLLCFWWSVVETLRHIKLGGKIPNPLHARHCRRSVRPQAPSTTPERQSHDRCKNTTTEWALSDPSTKHQRNYLGLTVSDSCHVYGPPSIYLKPVNALD